MEKSLACSLKGVKSLFPGLLWCARITNLEFLSSRMVLRCALNLESSRILPVKGSRGEFTSTLRRTVAPEKSKSSSVKKSRFIKK